MSYTQRILKNSLFLKHSLFNAVKYCEMQEVLDLVGYKILASTCSFLGSSIF